MNAWLAFFLGCAIGYGSSGYVKSPYWHQKVQIYGGAMTSSPVADVWGYADDLEGCRTLAAGANFMNHQETKMSTTDWERFVGQWAIKGTTSCQISN
jgi:hypothetical protein